jgi:Predicted membrane protein
MVIFQNIKKLIQVGLFLDKNKVKEQLNKIVLGIGIFLFIAVMIPPSISIPYTDIVIPLPYFRELIGEFVDIFMSPIVSLVGESNFFLILSLLAIITGVYSALIQKYTVDQSKVLESQEKMKIFQKEMREAQQTQNTYMLKKLEEQQAEIMQENMGMMKNQMKPMFYVVIVSLPIFMWIYYYIGLHPDASLIFPFWGKQFLNDNVLLMFTYGIYWYFISSLAFGQVFRKLLNIRAAGM